MYMLFTIKKTLRKDSNLAKVNELCQSQITNYDFHIHFFPPQGLLLKSYLHFLMGKFNTGAKKKKKRNFEMSKFSKKNCNNFL